MVNVVLYAHRWTPDMFSPIPPQFPEVNFIIPNTDEEFEAALPMADALFGSFTKEQYKLVKNLKWVQYQGSGVNWITSIPEFLEDDILLTNTRGAHASTIAEHTFGLLIGLARGLYPLAIDQHHHHWRRPLVDPAVGLDGYTIGILGYGKIGQAVAERAVAFNMQVVCCDVFPVQESQIVKKAYTFEQLDDFLHSVNFLVITAPLTEQTENLIGLNEMKSLRHPSYLISVSRGGIVNEDDLRVALTQGDLDGAGLDVQTKEPLPSDSFLWDLPHCILTPHCSGESLQTNAHILNIFAGNLRRFQRGENLMNLVDKKKGF